MDGSKRQDTIRVGIGGWTARARDWTQDGVRDVYLFFISGAKVRNPAAARAVIERLG